MDVKLKWTLLWMGVALLWIGLFAATAYRDQQRYYAAINTMRSSPDNFKFPTCTSPSGYGLVRSMHDYQMYLFHPDGTYEPIIGDWRQYRAKLPNLTCDES